MYIEIVADFSNTSIYDLLIQETVLEESIASSIVVPIFTDQIAEDFPLCPFVWCQANHVMMALDSDKRLGLYIMSAELSQVIFQSGFADEHLICQIIKVNGIVR